MAQLHAVTGAFGYTGSYIARALLTAGKPVIALTGRRQPEELLPTDVPVFPYDFDRPDVLAEHLRGVDVLYNTYWVRFDHGAVTFGLAVERIGALLAAAKPAGVRRVVHVSVTNASALSPLPYFRGKGVVEAMVRECGMSYTIVRPALVFGHGDILLNNIAWFLRHSPVFMVPEGGRYRVQPIAAEDLADIVVRAGEGTEDSEFDAVGPDDLSFWDLVRLIRGAVGGSPLLVGAPSALALAATRLAGVFMGDVVLTADEVAALKANLLTSGSAALGRRWFADWLREDGATLGRAYQSEVARHYRG